MYIVFEMLPSRQGNELYFAFIMVLAWDLAQARQSDWHRDMTTSYKAGLVTCTPLRQIVFSQTPQSPMLHKDWIRRDG